MLGTHACPEQHLKYIESGEWAGLLLDTHVRDAAKTNAHDTVYFDRGRAVSFLEFDIMVDKVAASLLEMGVVAGDVVSWQLPNWVEASVVHFAAIRMGAVSNPIVPIYRSRELTFILKQTKSRVLFVPSVFRKFDYVEMAKELIEEVPTLDVVITVGENNRGYPQLGDLLERNAPIELNEHVRSTNIAVLLYTSGTTSDPKGVLHSHDTLDYALRCHIELFALCSDDRIFMPTPVSHSTGMLFGLHLPFVLKSLCVLQDIWSAQKAVDLIDSYHCTFSVGATPFLHGLLEETEGREDGSFGLKRFGCGGADVPPDLIRRAHKQWGGLVARGYGSSECPNALVAAGVTDPEKRATTDGRPIGSTEVRIVDSDGTNVDIGVEGEIELRGPELFLGYLDATLNSEAFVDGGWFRTGDVGCLDADGLVTITGRTKDIILRGGENISAKEVEDLIFMHSAVEAVAVVGEPHDVLVERVCAFVVLKSGAVMDLPKLTDYLREHRLAVQKLPERLVFVKDLPRTASGKIRKFELREQAKKLARLKG